MGNQWKYVRIQELNNPDCFGYHKGCDCQDCKDIDQMKAEYDENDSEYPTEILQEKRVS
jgi:hypothetical protein